MQVVQECQLFVNIHKLEWPLFALNQYWHRYFFVLVLCTVGANRGLIRGSQQLVHTYTQIFSPIKNCFFPGKKYFPKFFFDFCFYFYSMQLFSADPTMFSKKCLTDFLPKKALKKWPQKLLIIGPKLFFHSPAHSPDLFFML